MAAVSENLFTVVSSRCQFLHAAKVCVSTSRRVYLLDVSGYFRDATSVVVDGTRALSKGSNYAVLSDTAQKLCSGQAAAYLGLHAVVLSIDNIGVFLSASAAPVLALGDFSHQVQGPAISTIGMQSIGTFYPRNTATEIVESVQKSAENLRQLDGDESWNAVYITAMWRHYGQ